MIFDSSQKLTLENVNKYLETQGVKLSAQDKKQVASIFAESDNQDNKKGELNVLEAMKFSNLIEKVLPNIREKIDNFIHELGLEFKPERRPIQKAERDAIPDPINEAQKVENKKNAGKTEKAQKEKSDEIQKAREKIVDGLYRKWSKTFAKRTTVGKEFYNKLYDTLGKLHCKIKEKDFDPINYSSIEEQTMDRVLAIFANESGINPKEKTTVKNKEGKRITYYGLFKFSPAGYKTAVNWAKKHPNVSGMKNINPKISINEYLSLGSKQLDYLVALIGANRKTSGLTADEPITPEQLWSMIKSPYNGKENTTSTQKQAGVINRVFLVNSLDKGIKN